MNIRQQFINESFKFVAILENSGDFIFRQAGLTVKTYSILHLISTGSDSSKSLLSGTYGSKPNMTKKINFLEDNGFITRKADMIDKRISRFFLTEKAHFALEKISPIYDRAIAQIFQGVSDTDMRTALKVLKKCLDNMESYEKKSI